MGIKDVGCKGYSIWCVNYMIVNVVACSANIPPCVPFFKTNLLAFIIEHNHETKNPIYIAWFFNF
jgi:hypothetical protein